MPGLTMWLTAPGERDAGTRFRRAQQLMVRSPSDRAVVDVERGSCFVGHVAYPGYPVRTWHDAGSTIVLEGHVYGRPDDQVERELRELFREAFDSADPLPLVSAGLSSLIVTMVTLGMLMSFAKREPGASQALAAAGPGVPRRILSWLGLAGRRD